MIAASPAKSLLRNGKPRQLSNRKQREARKRKKLTLLQRCERLQSLGQRERRWACDQKPPKNQ